MNAAMCCLCCVTGGLFVDLPEQIPQSSMLTEADLQYYVGQYKERGFRSEQKFKISCSNITSWQFLSYLINIIHKYITQIKCTDSLLLLKLSHCFYISLISCRDLCFACPKVNLSDDCSSSFYWCSRYFVPKLNKKLYLYQDGGWCCFESHILIKKSSINKQYSPQWANNRLVSSHRRPLNWYRNMEANWRWMCSRPTGKVCDQTSDWSYRYTKTGFQQNFCDAFSGHINILENNEVVLEKIFNVIREEKWPQTD